MKAQRWLPILGLALLLAGPAWSRDQYEDLVKTIPFEELDELRVEIEIGVADLLVEAVKGNHLLEADIHYKVDRGEPRIRFERSGRVGYLTIKSAESDENDDDGTHVNGLRSGDENWELRFSPKIPTSFTVDVGLVDGRLDLSGMKVTDLDISSGLSDLDLYFDEPNPVIMKELRIECGLGDFKGRNLGNANFERLRAEGGLGSIVLDLSGQWRVPEADIKVEVGLGSARLEVPASLGVEVHAEENFLASLDLDRHINEVRKGLHRSDNWNRAASKLLIDAEVGLGSLRIELIPD